MTLYSLALLVAFLYSSDAFAPRTPHVAPSALFSAPSDTVSVSETQQSVKELKKVLEREYVTFFDPMRTEYYATDVTFDDPLNDLDGVAAYQSNVDMLGARTLFGSLLFEDSSIVLHSIEGGEVNEDGSISDITTRWTLRFTFKILPWAPTARFTGISVYNVVPGGPKGVLVKKQTDYWDSINMVEGGSYQKVSTGAAISDFVAQLKPGGFQAQGAAPEVPYELLRRGNGYEVRRYPSYSAVRLPYGRRDEGFGALGAVTKGMNPLSPAIMEVQNDDTSDKYMMWPLLFAAPGQESAPIPQEAIEKSSNGQWSKCEVVTIPSQVVAVAEFTDASMEPVVRRADRQLRECLERDGIDIPKDSEDRVIFAQYDAIFSMGKRRGEVWIPLERHPWKKNV